MVVVVSGSGENGFGDDDGTENEESFQESESQDWMEIVMTPKRGAFKGEGSPMGSIMGSIMGCHQGSHLGSCIRSHLGSSLGSLLDGV